MPTSDGQPSLADLRPGDHVCGLFRDEAEREALVVPYLRAGLEAEEKVLLMGDETLAGRIEARLRAEDVDVAAAKAAGQLVVLSARDTYLRDGAFDPDAMIRLVVEFTDAALAEGYPSVRGTGDMSWALREDGAAHGRLLEYEAKLNRVLPTMKYLAVCQYHLGRFHPDTVLPVLAAHPVAVLGSDVFPNFYYIPPDEFLGPERSAAMLRNWMRNLREHRASEARQRELMRLRELERVRGEFINAAAHELQTPLTPILLQLGELQRGARLGAAPPAASLAMLERNVQRMAEIVEDLLRATRAEGRRLVLEARHGLEGVDRSRPPPSS